MLTNLNTLKDLIQPPIELPCELSFVFKTFHCVHSTWRYYKRGKRIIKPDGHLITFADNLIGHLAKENYTVQCAAHWLKIAACISDCSVGYIKLLKNYQKVKGALWSEDILIDRPWPKDSSNGWISATSLYSLSITFEQQVSYIKKVSWRTYKLFLSILKLSLLTMDFKDSFSWDELARKEAVGEMASNTCRLLSKIDKNQEALLRRLKENEGSIQKILDAWGTNYSCEWLISNIEMIIKTNREASKELKTFSRSFSKNVKKITFGILRDTGFLDILSGFNFDKIGSHPWVHSAFFENSSKKKNNGIYIPINQKVCTEKGNGISREEAVSLFSKIYM